jgi:hypothetical protein
VCRRYRSAKNKIPIPVRKQSLAPYRIQSGVVEVGIRSYYSCASSYLWQNIEHIYHARHLKNPKHQSKEDNSKKRELDSRSTTLIAAQAFFPSKRSNINFQHGALSQ